MIRPMSKKVVVFSGAGMSEESGINTFRDADGLWEGHDFLTVASLDGWHKDPQLVLDFYNERRQHLLKVSPNLGHIALAELAEHADVSIVTQNVDNLHERAGSKNVIHLHGELLKSESSANPDLTFDCLGDITLKDRCPLGSQLRPHIVWFGEAVDKLDNAIAEVMSADIFIIIGTSLQVYPAAGLVSFIRPNVPVYYIDADPATNIELESVANLTIIKDTAAIGVPKLIKSLKESFS